MTTGDQLRVEIQPGVLIPMIGYGTWDVRPPDAYGAVRAALDAGYRHIDTAYGYGNEGDIGQALRDSGVAREEVFLTTKIPSRRVGFEEETIANSLRLLQTDYVDLWLIHDPPEGEKSERLWEFLIEVRGRGNARAIGVSNYSTPQIDAIVKATGVTPVVNQIKWTPALFDRERLQENRDRGIQLEGFSAIRRTDLGDPELARIADAHGVTTPQVLLRWHIDHGVIALPRSTKPERIQANLDVWDFTLTGSELDVIDAMSTVS
jgi:diketogulonate reductase-like aldo/keto reductase